ncbi:MAG: M48 family metallopeptidase [Candidatus Thorarchaeota archaeon]
MNRPPIVERVARDKWTAVIAFLVADFVQIALVSFLTLDSSSLWIVRVDTTQNNVLISVALFVTIAVVQVAILYYLAASMSVRPDMIQLFPKYLRTDAWTCKYSRHEIVEWTHDLAQKSGVQVSKIYLLRSPIPNAFTFSLPLLGSVVVLHSNLLALLSPQEARAVIAHELAHIKNHDSLIQILTRMPDMFIQVVYLYVYVRIGLGIADALLVAFNPLAALARLVALLVFYGASRLGIIVATVFIRRASRAAELLADYDAASVLGPLVTINALIRLGLRIEAINTLVREIQSLAAMNKTGALPVTDDEIHQVVLSLDPHELDPERARIQAPRIFLENRLRLLRDTYGLPMSDDDIMRLVETAAASLVKESALTTDSKSKPRATVDWRRIDLDGDERLDREELDRLLATLRNNPDMLMFDNEVGKSMMMLDHPDFRRRILFLADVLQL